MRKYNIYIFLSVLTTLYTYVLYFFLERFVILIFFSGSILVPPDIINDDTSGDLSVSEGENATLWCRATGHPTPRIAWRREDGQAIILRRGAREAIKGKRSRRKRNEKKIL